LFLGLLPESQGNWQCAQANYQKVLDLQSDNALTANNLPYSMIEHGGNIVVALSLAETARRGLPDSPSTADTLAWAYIQKETIGRRTCWRTRQRKHRKIKPSNTISEWRTKS
jgi:hypothetical protein